APPPYSRPIRDVQTSRAPSPHPGQCELTRAKDTRTKFHETQSAEPPPHRSAAESEAASPSAASRGETLCRSTPHARHSQTVREKSRSAQSPPANAPDPAP